MRYYHTGIGRFMSRDMLAQAVAEGKITPAELEVKGIKLPMHLYAYSDNNPAGKMDSTGNADSPAVPETPKPPKPPKTPPTHEKRTMNMKRLKKRLKTDEGYDDCRYKDSEGKWTIGIGHNLQGGKDSNVKLATGKPASEYRDKDTRMSPEEIGKLFEADVKDATKDVKKVITNSENLDPMAQEICVEMVFQMGKEGLAKHKKMVKALEKGDYKEAAKEIRDSMRWRKQTRARAEDQAKRMENISPEPHKVETPKPEGPKP